MVSLFYAPSTCAHCAVAAYQVGLSFLTTHMRRAVSTCTSPEVFFGPAGANEAALLTANLPSTDPLGLAMEALSV